MGRDLLPPHLRETRVNQHPSATVGRRELLQSAGVAALSTLLPSGAASAATSAPADSATLRLNASEDDLARAFRDPPAEAKPGVFWYWMNGAVTREGITADLTAMATAGFGRAILFTIGLGRGPDATGLKSYASLTPEWWDIFGFAIEEAGRVGMEITVGACDGWATAAGPWITPELSMQRVVASESWVAGGARFAGPLPRPLTAMGYYRDIRTIAFPLPRGWSNSVDRAARVTSSVGDAAGLNAHHGDAALSLDRPGWIRYAFDRPFTVRSIIAVDATGQGAGAGFSLEVSDDGILFRAVGKLAQADERTLAAGADLARGEHLSEPRYVVAGTAAVTGRAFRLVFTPGAADAKAAPGNFAGPNGDPVVPPAPTRLKIARLVLLDEPVITDLNTRSARAWALPPHALSEIDLPAEACVAPGSIVDLTDKVAPDGRLDWTPPATGTWKIVRIGHTSTGAINGTGFPAGRGLECDKMSVTATRLQFDHWLGELTRRVDRRRAGHALSTMHTDSWECGSQNWTPAFPAEFAKRRGYDLGPLLPVMAGVPISSADTVNRVLTDVRRTVAEATADNFFGELARLGRAAGYHYSAEPANPIYPTDPLIFAKHADRPMGEFWVYGDDKPSDVADAVHGGHVYGKRVIGAEAFTEFAMQWNETPFSCKPLGDANWAKGVNQLTCHVWAAQPWTDAAHEPGMTLANIGVFFSRTNVWYDMAKPWFDYMRRSQALLQQGRPIVDIACYLGEDIPARAYVPANTPMPIPEGYAFDSINTDALMTLAQVRDGWIVLPNGQRYAALLLPRDWRVSPRVLTRIAALVRAGATVIGAAPLGSIGLEGGANGPAEVAALTRTLWSGEGLHKHGLGQIGHTPDLASTLRSRTPPDCVIAEPRPAAGAISPFLWTHRAGKGWDLYFLSSQSDVAQRVHARFRANGRIAELWDADTGAVRPLEQRTVDGTTEVVLPLDPCGSAFVIFRDAARAVTPRPPAPIAPIAIDGPWEVGFTRGLATPRSITLRHLQSWSTLSDEALRHYAGTAVYRTTFTAPATAAGLHLDLGDVAEVCEVELNGRVLRRLWKPPYRVELGDAVRPGANTLVVRVVNTWRNRLIGDVGKPAAERQSFTVTPFFTGKPDGLPPAPDPKAPTTDADGFYLGGGFGNDARGVPLRGTPAGTPPPMLKGASRFGFPGGGSSAPGPDVRRKPDKDGLLLAGLLGPVRLLPNG